MEGAVVTTLAKKRQTRNCVKMYSWKNPSISLFLYIYTHTHFYLYIHTLTFIHTHIKIHSPKWADVCTALQNRSAIIPDRLLEKELIEYDSDSQSHCPIHQ